MASTGQIYGFLVFSFKLIDILHAYELSKLLFMIIANFNRPVRSEMIFEPMISQFILRFENIT